ncbi:MAG: LL-diaminopimelate aminotransferase [Desulfobacteraceae bacterium]|nr:LL-diaminopimelate aminotransferase [Desulfobacteraceae bacterium]
MITINEHYLKLEASYLFSNIAKRVSAYQSTNPDKEIIKLGIGDVTLPLPPVSVQAFHAAVDEMSNEATFRGYGPEQGYLFLREAIAANDYQARGADISAEEIFVSDGAKCDTGNIQELFGPEIRIAVPDPVYPVYVDTNVMAGRTGSCRDQRYDGLVYMDCTADNGFIPELPNVPVDLIYLCYPNNPTGATITGDQLRKWVDFAKDQKALILFDAAYEAFITDPGIPHSIYEVEGAREVAIEFRSFSKTAGFTGTRCAYTVVPKTCLGYRADGKAQSLHDMWHRRHSTKFNGVSYPVQKAAAATYSPEGRKQVRELIDYYLRNARTIRNEIASLGYDCVGGINSPYIWINGREDSWAFFDRLLENSGVVCTPGAGFGKCGDGFIRISAFNNYTKVQLAMEKIRAALG